MLLITAANVLIGPMGWVGWGVAIVLAAILWHLWRSSGPKELRKLNRAMRKATETIDIQDKKILELTNRNEVLSTDNFEKEQLIKELTGKIERQDKAIDILNESITRCGIECKKAMKECESATKKADAFETRVLQLLAQAGMPIDLKNLEGKDTGSPGAEA